MNFKLVKLPENYVAFVLPNANQAPSDKDLDKLRFATIEYLQRKLIKEFPSLQSLQLQFLASEFESQQPAPRFNLYLQVQASVQFQLTRVPETAQVFESYVSSFTEDYLDQAIRKLDNAPFLQDAVEVRARRIGPGTPGGAVTAPRFYMAFVVPSPKEPTPKEKEALLKKSKKEFTRLLKQEFDNDFDELKTLKIVKTAIHEAKPEPKYNVYIEFEAVAAFTKNVPEPMDFFRPIAVPPPKFTSQLKKEIGGPCFVGGEMVVRCVFVETPNLPEEEEEEEEEQDGEPDEGEDDEKAAKQKERLQVKVELGFYVALVISELQGMPNPNQLQKFDQLMQDFFSKTLKDAFKKSFVDLTLEPSPQFQAGMPLARFNMLHQYNATMHFYHPPPDGTDVLKKILYCNLSDLYTKINPGLGCPPYNDMLEFTLGRALEKQVTDQAYGGTLGLEELQKKKEAEEAARRAAEEKKRKEEEKRRQEEAARRAAQEEKKRQEAAAKALAEKKRKEAEAARRRAAEEKKRQEAAAKAAAEKAAAEKAAAEKALAEKVRKEKEAARREAEGRARKEKEREEAERKRKEEAARREAAERARKEKERKDAEEAERKRKEEAARREAEERARKEKAKQIAEEKRKQEAAKAKKEAEPEPTIPVGTADVFMAFNLPECKSEPSKSQYDALAATTQDFYAKHLKKKYTTVRGVEVAVSRAFFGQNKPDKRYNVYLEWNIKVSFAESGGVPPNRYQLCTSLVTSVDLGAYMSKHMLSLKGTPFVGVRGVFTEQVNSMKS